MSEPTAIRTICCKLRVQPEDVAVLHTTQVAFNAAATYCADLAWQRGITNKLTLHHLVYYDTRSRFGLGAQLACCARTKAIEAIKAIRERGDTTCPSFRPTSSIRYDARSFSLRPNQQVSLNTLQGRITATLVLGPFQRTRLADPAWEVGGAELICRGATWYLHITQSQPLPLLHPTQGVIGCDLGIVNLCTTNEGTVYSGATVKRVRHKRFKHRQRLQQCGSRNAKRRLCKQAAKERRFQQDVNHCISKALVAAARAASGTLWVALRLEDLTDIRQRVEATVRHAQRREHSAWAFRQLRMFVTYKAQQAGVLLELVDPRNTSRRCFVCGHTEKANRKSQAIFHCQNTSCGHIAAADVNAALNIAFWAVVSQPIAPVLRDEAQARRFSGG